MVMLLRLWWRHHPWLRLWWRHQPRLLLRLLRRHQPRLRLRRRHQRRLRLLVVVLKSVEVVVGLRGWHQPAVRVAVLLLLVVIHLPFVLTAAARQPRAGTGGIKAVADSRGAVPPAVWTFPPVIAFGPATYTFEQLERLGVVLGF